MIEYLESVLSFDFEKTLAEENPLFVIRSILGFSLKSATCLFPDKSCSTCGLKYNCHYSKLFESYANPELIKVFGTNKLPHPYMVQQCKKSDKNLTVKLILLGDIKQFADTIIQALKNTKTFGKNKNKYVLTLVSKEEKKWFFDSSNLIASKHVLIRFLTPTRMLLDRKSTRLNSSHL